MKRRARKGAIHPRNVLVPGWLVDYIVVDPSQPQSANLPDRHIEGVEGGLSVPEPSITVYPLNADKLAGRRASLELHPGDVINCGAGVALSGLAPVSREEGIAPLYTQTVEHGTSPGSTGASMAALYLAA